MVASAGCAFGPPNDEDQGTPPKLPSPSTSSGSDDGGATVQVIAKRLTVPWGIAFLPDGTALVTERDSGKILELKSKGGSAAKPKTVQTIDASVHDGEGGLLGIAVSPKYETDKTIFVYYSTDKDWSSYYIHYQVGDGAWTTAPGPVE